VMGGLLHVGVGRRGSALSVSAGLVLRDLPACVSFARCGGMVLDSMMPASELTKLVESVHLGI